MSKLVKRIASLQQLQETIIFQYGSRPSDSTNPSLLQYPYIPQDALLRYMKRARVIICHGGPGTIYQSLSFGKIPWVLPRQRKYKEHLTDHQLSFCQFMKRRRLIRIITDKTPLPDLLQGSLTITPIRRKNTHLIAYLDSLLPFKKPHALRHVSHYTTHVRHETHK